MPVTGGEEERVLDSLPSSLWGGWALAGNDLIYLSLTADDENPAQIMVRSLTSGKTRKAATLRLAPVLWDGSLSVSKDGRYALVAEVERAGSEIHLQRAP